MQYLPIPFHWTKDDIAVVLARGDPDELLYVPLVVSLQPTSRVEAEQICLQLAAHPHPNVRGVAIESFAHIARNFRALDKHLIYPVLSAALHDKDEWVRGKARDAVEEIAEWLGWEFETEPKEGVK